eukprot:PhF_6_TR18908/c1_g1_i1/m.27610/K06210/NMNAT; nicotinamide mononucleotide adenylyltransferase
MSAPTPYVFPTEKLSTPTPGKKPVVLAACGSFNPITMMHLRIMEIARDEIHAREPNTHVVGGYLSPVADAYGKSNLIAACHRVPMVQLGLSSSSWVMCDDWEARQPEYKRTFYVLDHIRSSLPEGYEVRLVLGADVFQSMVLTKPGTTIPVWKLDTLILLLDNFPIVVTNRDGTSLESVFAHTMHDEENKITVVMEKYRGVTTLISPQERNDLSSTYIRSNIASGKSNKYLMPDEVIAYIAANKLYLSKV